VPRRAGGIPGGAEREKCHNRWIKRGISCDGRMAGARDILGVPRLSKPKPSPEKLLRQRLPYKRLQIFAFLCEIGSLLRDPKKQGS
jgi:hypothetical protein